MPDGTFPQGASLCTAPPWRPSGLRSAIELELVRERCYSGPPIVEGDAGPWIRGDEIDATDTADWLWTSWLALGELCLLAADPKAGKSTVVREIVAGLTKGEALPGDTSRTPINVIYIATEEHLGRVAAALKATGADLRRVVFRDQDWERWTAADPESLIAAVKETGARLVVLDHIKDMIHASPSEHETEIRAGLIAVQSVARVTGAAVLCVAHHKKGEARAIHKMAGTIAWTAVPASTLGLVDDPHHDRRVLYRAGGRFDSDPVPLAFKIVGRDSEGGVVEEGGSGAVEWLGPVEEDWDPDTNVGREAPSAGRSRTAACAQWFEEALRDGPVHSVRLIADAKANGWSGGTYERARSQAGVGAFKSGARWWSYLGDEAAAKAFVRDATSG